MRAVIFANGVLNNLQDIHDIILPDDLIIAADGGMTHCRALDIKPSVVVGDLDSLDPDYLKSLQTSGTEIISYPINKDQTDLEIALRKAIDLGSDEILLLGALGARWDMTIANLLLSALPEFSKVTIRLIDGHQEIILLKGRSELTFKGKKGDMLSLIPLGQEAYGVTLRGLKYPLENDVLRFGATRGISNVLIDDSATVYLKKGLLLCIHISKN
ncbi:MAG: thiamine diphosphokinase [Desulfobacteraceae bacterium]|nr:thiamine diphosphokinase [Desulfobacteraceae bacterium]MBC2720353.1 thiamine diphosphokinase [Desulfobacteraceae bacterium]